jgi:predicted enzyme related to lactoylglutathione lyase
VEPIVESDSWAYVEPHGRGPLLNIGGQPPGAVRIAFQQVPEVKLGKVRLHIDIGVWELEAAAIAAVALGGSRLSEPQREPGGSYFIVMADPEGHEFCFVDP